MTENRRQILEEIIKKNPGIQFCQIMRLSGLKNGVLSHHLNSIEKSGKISVDRKERVTRYFPLDVKQDDRPLINALRNATQRQIIEVLALHPKSTFGEIVSDTGKAQSTVSFYLSKLVEDKIVKEEFIERKKRYHVADIQKINEIIDVYSPSKIQEASDNFEEIFTSL